MFVISNEDAGTQSFFETMRAFRATWLVSPDPPKIVGGARPSGRSPQGAAPPTNRVFAAAPPRRRCLRRPGQPGKLPVAATPACAVILRTRSVIFKQMPGIDAGGEQRVALHVRALPVGVGRHAIA